MAHLELIRVFRHPRFGTGGLLSVPGLARPLFTVEVAWRNNQKGASCVPVGDYTLEPHPSRKYGKTWALVGETVSHYEQPGKARSACLIHAANFSYQLRGCIAPGMSVWMAKFPGVMQSRKAMGEIKRVLELEEVHTLSVRDWPG